MARDSPPSLKKIAKAHDRRADHCWRCDYDGKGLERAHIVAHSHGGSNDPDNYFILCHVCHGEQPDGASREVQLAWIDVGESMMTRIMREFDELHRAMVLIGGRKAFEDYVTALADDSHETIMEKLSCLDAAGPKNGRANRIWGVVEDFNNWLKERT